MVQERAVQAAPVVVHDMSLREAIPRLAERSMVASDALRAIAKELSLSDSDKLLESRLLDDELTRNDEARLYFRLASTSGATFDCYALARYVVGTLVLEWHWCHH